MVKGASPKEAGVRWLPGELEEPVLDEVGDPGMEGRVGGTPSVCNFC